MYFQADLNLNEGFVMRKILISLFAVLFTSIIIAACGYIVNENNADVLLAGYNTMSNDEKNKFDLVNYLKFFRTISLASLTIEARRVSSGLMSGCIFFIIFL